MWPYQVHNFRGRPPSVRRADSRARDTTSSLVSEDLDAPSAVLSPRRLARGLRHPVRRTTLAIVLGRDRPVGQEALTEALRREHERAASGEGLDGLSVRVALTHRHLPILQDCDLVATRASGVVPGDHPLLSSGDLDEATLRRADVDWQALGAVFGQPRRQVAVRVLGDADLPLSLVTLARAVAAEQAGDFAPAAPIVEYLQVRLHHVDLPMLADAGVVSYDADDRRVTALSAPSLPIPVPGV